MIRYLCNRIGHAVVVMFGVVSLVFLLLHVAGDPLAGLMPPGSSPAVEAELRHQFGLDRPLVEQYATFVAGGMRGDFGDSWRQQRPALAAVLERLPASVWLTLAAMGLAVLVGGTLGVESAVSPSSFIGRVVLVFAIAAQAIPAFWLGTILIYFFAVRLDWLPSSGMDGPVAIVLPSVTLAAYPAAMIARLIRAAMGEALSSDYVRTARAKGLSHWRLVFDHALRNALLPTLSFVGLQAGFFFGGAVVVEGVFAYPGIGMLALDAAFSRDIPIVGAFVWTVALLILTVNLALDVVAARLDPRSRTDAGFTMAAS